MAKFGDFRYWLGSPNPPAVVGVCAGEGRALGRLTFNYGANGDAPAL